MSPLSLRRYRAERLLRADFEALRARVLASVRASLPCDAARSARLDLDACYAAAWQALYAATVEGREIANPAGWLAVVTRRRAIDELRAESVRAGLEAEHASSRTGASERDLAGEIDDSSLIAGLVEGMRVRLGPREREAAALCYLHGMTRAQAALYMGISERSLRRLMEGGAGGRAGVAAKIGALVDVISAGEWCEEQRSLMRALAFGLLDPEGERYRIAAAHRSRCPACRAYVVSLRGLAAVLPPPLLPLAREALGAALAGTTAGAHGAPAAGAAKGASAASAGSSAAGGSWAIAAAPVVAKLTAGCLLIVGVGVGCAELGGAAPHRLSHPFAGAHGVRAARQTALASRAPAGRRRAAPGEPRSVGSLRRVPPRAVAPASGAGATREFGIERQPPAAPAVRISASAAAVREFGPG
ncbi:MAG TPA: sigma-70 family RNA polymerase sigma factor [Solirubrobacteraceae bacterium]|jgi:DNA-directed RNA polymerase specialized sigma24 family protein|nr:sigma-70 family RNA polymerase sigma factor [Solirubrobacteraceae bacterium]